MEKLENIKQQITHFENLRIVNTQFSKNRTLISAKIHNNTLFYYEQNTLDFNLEIITQSDNFIKAIKLVFFKDFNNIIILYKNLKNLVERGDNEYFRKYAKINNIKITDNDFIRCYNIITTI